MTFPFMSTVPAATPGLTGAAFADSDASFAQKADSGCSIALLQEWHVGTLIGRISSNGQDQVCVSGVSGTSNRCEGFN